MALFGSLGEKLSVIADSFRGKSRISEKDLRDMNREIKMALLEADVNYTVVKDIMADIAEKAKGEEVLKSLTPGQQIVKILHESLIKVLGSDESKIKVSPDNFTVLLLCGLQGSGKTTMAAKLARMLSESGKKPFLISVDVHRPAAQEQLQILADEINVPCYIDPAEKNAVTIAEAGLEKARYLLKDTVIVDTAGRMTVNEELMRELADIEAAVKPSEKMLVLDAMTGQEAVNIAQSFSEGIGIDALIMTKLDGDARGGAALSLRKTTGIPLKFIGTGEKTDAIEAFVPERMASRILGMGDVLTLIEKAEKAIDAEEAERSYKRLKSNTFTLQDMMEQLEKLQNMGSVKDLLSYVPGFSSKVNEIDENESNARMAKNLAILRSMTYEERNNPKLLNASRRKRIAKGSGTMVSDVNAVIKGYEQTKNMMKSFMGMNKFGKRRLSKMFSDKNLPF